MYQCVYMCDARGGELHSHHKSILYLCIVQYASDGMFFKFAVDHKGLYGGTEFARKAANHERKGLQVRSGFCDLYALYVVCLFDLI